MKCPKCDGYCYDGNWPCERCQATGQVSVPCPSLPSWSVEHLRQTLEAMSQMQELTWVARKDDEIIPLAAADCYITAGGWLCSMKDMAGSDRATVWYGGRSRYIASIVDAPDATTHGKYIDAVRRCKVIVEIGEEVPAND